MFLNTEAIVLRTIQYSDSRLVVTLFTQEEGVVSAIFQVGKRSSKRSLLEPFSLVNLVLKRERTNLYFIRDISPVRILQGIATGAEKRLVAMFMAEVVYRTQKESQQDVELFQFLQNSICFLNQFSGEAMNFSLLFMIEYAKRMGVTPNLDSYSDGSLFDYNNGVFLPCDEFMPFVADATHSKLLRRFLSEDFYSIEAASYTPAETSALLAVIRQFLETHIPEFKYIKSLDIIRELI